jgi:hypothetical protein
MAKVGNLDAKLGCYFKLFIIIADVGNLYINIGVILNYFL